MSDQTPTLGDSGSNAGNFFAGRNFFTNSPLLRLSNQTFPGGTTLNNFHLLSIVLQQPIGYMHFHTSGAGDLTVTGLISGYNLPPSFTQLLFVKNDGPGNLILTEQDPLSLPENRFDFGGAGNQTFPPNPSFGASVLLIYDPDVQRWQPGP